jgi:hypothetical protein
VTKCVENEAAAAWVTHPVCGVNRRKSGRTCFSILFVYSVVDGCAEIFDVEKFISEV